MRFSYRSLLAALALSVAVVFSGCDSAEFEAPEPPAVISPQAFDVSALTAITAHAAQATLGGLNPEDNFLNAAARDGITSGVIAAQLAIPAAATAAALVVEPVFESGTYVWMNTIIVADQEVTFRLEGQFQTANGPINPPVSWQMTVFVEDPGTGHQKAYLLYEATTDFEGNSGEFTIYAPINNVDTPVLHGEFDVPSTNVHSSTFTSLTDVYEHGGDTATYDINGDDARFELVEPHNGRTHLVEWSISNFDGRLVATDYNNGDPACWNGDLEDIPCP